MSVDFPRKVVVRLLSGAIWMYQAATVFRPSPCRFWPTCSTYAQEAIEAHGPFKGGWLAMRRLGRCNPWGRWGPDPVPEPASRPSRPTPPGHPSSCAA